MVLNVFKVTREWTKNISNHNTGNTRPCLYKSQSFVFLRDYTTVSYILLLSEISDNDEEETKPNIEVIIYFEERVLFRTL